MDSGKWLVYYRFTTTAWCGASVHDNKQDALAECADHVRKYPESEARCVPLSDVLRLPYHFAKMTLTESMAMPLDSEEA